MNHALARMGKERVARLTGMLLLSTVLAGLIAYRIFAAGAPSASSPGGGSRRQPAANGNGLAAWYHFDGSAADSTANAQNLNSSAVSYASGKFGNAAQFDGSSSYAVSASAMSFSAASDQTYSMWFKSSASTTGPLLEMSSCGGTPDNGCTTAEPMIGWDNGNGNLDTDTYVNGHYSAGAPSSYRDGLWHYLAVSFSTAGTKVYVDGSLVATNSGYSMASHAAASEYMFVGARSRTSGLSMSTYRNFNGAIDDLRVYSRALSQAEVTQLYQGSQPAGCDQFCTSYLKLDDNSGSTASNSVSGATGGTLNNFNFNSSSGWTSGVFASGLLFDGVDDYVSLPDQGLTKGSVEFWINPTVITGDQRLFSQASGLTTQAGSLALNQSSGESGSLWVWDGAAWQRLSDSGSIGAGVWNHVVVDYGGSNATAFVNGIQAYTANAGFAFNGVGISIGGKSFGSSGGTYSGVMDDVRISSRALAPEEAAEHYRLGL